MRIPCYFTKYVPRGTSVSINQGWYDLLLSGMLTAAKKNPRDYINFVLGKMYERYFQLIYSLVHLN